MLKVSRKFSEESACGADKSLAKTKECRGAGREALRLRERRVWRNLIKGLPFFSLLLVLFLALASCGRKETKRAVSHPGLVIGHSASISAPEQKAAPDGGMKEISQPPPQSWAKTWGGAGDVLVPSTR